MYARHATQSSPNGGSDAGALQLDAMECALDGIPTAAAAADLARAASARADADPEQIMLALRGLPVFPTPVELDASSSTPEAAFIVSGGPTCLLRETLLPPYPHPEAPRQLYATIDAARRAQNIGEYKPAVRALRTVLLVWKKKHLWALLRAHPEMTLTEALREEVHRAEERRARLLYKEEQRARHEAEEREFQRRMMEQGEDGAEADSSSETTNTARQHDDTGSVAGAGASHDHDDDEYSEEEDDEFSGDEHDEAHQQRQRRRHAKKESIASAGAAATPTATSAAENPADSSRFDQQPEEEVLEFPTVTPEEELEFLTFYYNILGAIYQSAGVGAAASSSSSSRSGSGGRGEGFDGVRWGRLRVVPCPANSDAVRAMIDGTKGGSILATSVNAQSQPSYAANLATSIIEEVEDGEEDGEQEEDFIASSPSDLSNNSDLRALIALWQAKRAHDLYVHHRESEKNRLLAEARERDAIAKGKDPATAAAELQQQEAEDDLESVLGHHHAGSGASSAANLNQHTALGHPGFTPTINRANLTLAELQAEANALGLFNFQTINSLTDTTKSTSTPSTGSNSAATPAATLTQSGVKKQQNHVFWSTQPILLPVGGSSTAKGTDSQKSIGSAHSTASLHRHQSSLQLQPTSGGTGTGVGQRLINPYVQCSSGDAVTYSNLGATLFHLGNYPLALRCFFVALQIRTATIAPMEDEYVDVATSLNNIGVVLTQLSAYTQAWTYFQAALELAKQRLDVVHPRLALITTNLTKIKSRRLGVTEAPGLLAQLRALADAKEMKEHLAREKRNAKAAKKGANGKPGSAGPNSSRSGMKKPGKKDDEKPKEFHEDTRFFQPPIDGQPSIVLPALPEDAPPRPLGSAAAAITVMPLRQFDVQMGDMQKLLLEFGPARKKKSGDAAGGKPKKGKSKKK